MQPPAGNIKTLTSTNPTVYPALKPPLPSLITNGMAAVASWHGHKERWWSNTRRGVKFEAWAGNESSHGMLPSLLHSCRVYWQQCASSRGTRLEPARGSHAAS